MKRIYLILTLIAVAFSSCETDFEVNADWKEVAVVYGLLDKSEDKQFIKINKAYLGEGDAMQMGSIADSVNFTPEDLLVKMYRIKYGDTLASVTLDTTLIEKDGDMFSAENNIIYTYNTSDLLLNKNSRYALTIENLKTGNFVSSNTEVITSFSFERFADNFGFYNPGLVGSDKYSSQRLEWAQTSNGQVYQLDIRFNYLEDGELRNLIWSQGLVSFDGRNMSLRLEGAEFFNFLRNNLSENETIRQFVNLDLVMTVGTQDLETYIKVNEPITGIVQERPQFTNINNGIGLFSSRYTHEEMGIGLTACTRLYLLEELDRNFILNPNLPQINCLN